MKQRRVLQAVAIPLVCLFVAASCGGSDDTSTPAPDGTTASGATTPDKGTSVAAPTVPDIDTSVVANTDEIKPGGDASFGLEAEATGLRPWDDACSSPCYNIMVTIYDKFMEQTKDGKYEPYLAESLTPNDDFTVWVMTLRPDITFSNGTPLTAQTVADMFPIQQTGSAGASAINSSKVASVDATGDMEVTYTLSEGFVALPSYLSGAGLGMAFDPAAAAADPTGYSTNPIGTGPFVMSKRDLDNETVVTKNPEYWRTDANGVQLPYLDSITFRPIPDEGTSRRAAVGHGQLVPDAATGHHS